MLDFRVNELIRSKGFDTLQMDNDRSVSLAQLSIAVSKGYTPPSRWESVAMAMLLAEVFIESKNSLAQTDDVFGVLHERLPEEWCLAEDLTDIINDEPRTSADSVKRCIDKALTLCFTFAGEHLDLDCDLIEKPPSISWRDKWPGWMHGLTPQQKCEVGKAMARSGLGGKAQARLRDSTSGALAEFSVDGENWTPPAALSFHLPSPDSRHDQASRLMEINEQNRRRQMERFEAMRTGQQGRRAYATGEARFITQVRMEEMLAGEHPYAYAFNNPVTYTDPSGLQPQAGNQASGSYGVYSPCGLCAQAILSQWFPHPAHMKDHQYAHCMACCVLNQLGGQDCALGTQTNQNLIDVWPFKGRVGRIQGRYANCLDGIGINVQPPLSVFGSCQKGCQAEHPLPPGVPPFPPLPQCDPTNYQKRACPAGSWNYTPH